jgi:hypothetical protein
VLAGTVGGGFFLQGLAELVLRLDEPMPLLFWLPTLWGGAGLVLVGSFRINRSPGLAKALVMLGAVLGLLPSAWTILMPVLILVLVIRTISTSPAKSAID